MAFPPPQKCTNARCKALQNRWHLTKQSWLNTCTKHRATKKALSVGEMASKVEKAFVEAKRAQEKGDLEKGVDLKMKLSLEEEPQGKTMEEVVEEYKPYCKKVLDAIQEKTKWRFISEWVEKKYGNGPRFTFICAEDAAQNAERNGKAPGENGHSKERRILFPCSSTLELNFDLHAGCVSFIFRHHHFHDQTYSARTIPEGAAEKIRAAVRLGGASSGVIRDGLRLAGEDEGITSDQARRVADRAREKARGEGGKRKNGEDEAEHVKRVAASLTNLELLELDVVDGWEAVAFRVPAFAGEAEQAVEQLYDGTHGTTTGRWELVVGLAEYRTHGYPIALLLLRPSADRLGEKATRTAKAAASSRIRLFESFFRQVRDVCKCNPKITHLDKDFAEITAVETVWPGRKVQTCLWPTKKAVVRRLMKGESSQRTLYSAEEVKTVVEDVDLAWKPANAVLPKRVLPNTFLPPPPSASSSSNPSAASTFGARLVLSNKSRWTYLDPASQNLPAEVLAERRRLEYDDDDGNDDDDEDVGEDGRRVGVEEDRAERGGRGAEEMEDGGLAVVAGEADVAVSGEGQTVAKKRKRGGKKREPTKSIARSDAHLNALVRLLEEHWSHHPSFIYKTGRFRSADEIYRQSATEMHRYCRQHDLVDAWAYLWNSWYRPGRWHLWARSTYREVPVFRTTMAAESFFGRLKNKFLGKQGRKGLIDVLEKISIEMIPSSARSLTDLKHARSTLNFRGAKDAYRSDLTAQVRKVYKAEWALRQAEEAKRAAAAGEVPVDVVKRSASSSKGVLCYPPARREGRTDDENIDPRLLPPPPPPPKHHLANGTCSCPSFLTSRFLVCKHTILAAAPSVVGDGSVRDEQLWFSVVERRRTAPFWVVPPETRRLAVNRLLGVKGDQLLPIAEEGAGEGEGEDEEGRGVGDEDWGGAGDFGGGFEGEEGYEGAGGSGSEDEGVEGLEEESGGGEGEVGEQALPLYDAAADDSDSEEDHDLLDPSALTAGLRKHLDAFSQQILASVAGASDPRAYEQLGKELRQLTQSYKKREKEVGKGGRGSKRRKSGDGKRRGGEEVYC